MYVCAVEECTWWIGSSSSMTAEIGRTLRLPLAPVISLPPAV